MDEIYNKISFIDKLKLYSDVVRLKLKNIKRDYGIIDSDYNNNVWNRSFDDVNFETWQGNYNVVDGNTLRFMALNGKLFKGKWNDYTEKYKSQIFDVLNKYVDEPIVDLGCGLGYLLFQLYHRNFKELEGYDLSENAISLLKKYCQKKNYQINFGVLDLNKQFPPGIIENKIVFTHTSLEQLKNYMPNVLKNIIDGKPKIVINFEVDYNSESFWTRRYIGARDYQDNLVQELRKLEKQKKIEILSIKKLPWSLSPLNQPSVIKWKIIS
jgi:SAM-dependent methyltransferase